MGADVVVSEVLEVLGVCSRETACAEDSLVLRPLRCDVRLRLGLLVEKLGLELSHPGEALRHHDGLLRKLRLDVGYCLRLCLLRGRFAIQPLRPALAAAELTLGAGKEGRLDVLIGMAGRALSRHGHVRFLPSRKHSSRKAGGAQALQGKCKSRDSAGRARTDNRVGLVVGGSVQRSKA